MRAFKTGAAETSNRKSCCSTSSSTEAGPAKGRERASDAVSRLRPVARSRSQRVPTDASAHVPPSLRGTAELDLDIEELIRDRGELPTIERYRDRIDPVLQRDMAERVVERALALAGRHAAELARRWKARHARWTDVIDACLAAVTLDEPASAGESIGACVGASAADGHGRYQIVERLGSGAGGRTYEAVDRSMGARGADARVALKAIPSIGRDLDGLLAEAALARRVKSESVARVLDAGVLSPEHARILCEADSAIFLVHELIDGMPLHVWRAACPRPSARQLDRILGSIRDAVEACHRDGVAHGDLSPANVLITPDERAVLVDFGLGGPTSAAGAPEPASFDLLRYRELEAWLRPGRTDLRGWMHRRHAPVLIAAALIAVGSAAWLLQSTPQHGANADLSAGDRPALAAGPGIESRSWEWMISVLRDGISASYDRERLRAEADASRALAEEQRRTGAKRASNCWPRWRGSRAATARGPPSMPIGRLPRPTRRATARRRRRPTSPGSSPTSHGSSPRAARTRPPDTPRAWSCMRGGSAPLAFSASRHSRSASPPTSPPRNHVATAPRAAARSSTLTAA